MKELIRLRVQYASRQLCCKTQKRPLPLPLVIRKDDAGKPNKDNFLAETCWGTKDVIQCT